MASAWIFVAGGCVRGAVVAGLGEFAACVGFAEVEFVEGGRRGGAASVLVAGAALVDVSATGLVGEVVGAVA